jgi:hypothetical protein
LYAFILQTLQYPGGTLGIACQYRFAELKGIIA